MKNRDYVKAYEAAAAEFASLMGEQERIQVRIIALRKTMNLLAGLISQEDSEFGEYADATVRQFIDPTLTDDVLKLVSIAPGAMTTSDVRDELNKLGGSIAVHKNPLATINAVLKRLVEQGRIKETVKDGRKAWGRKIPADHPVHKLRYRYQDVPNPSGEVLERRMCS